jgi:glutamate 5-kinase
MSEIKEVDIYKIGTGSLTTMNEDGTFALDIESFHRIGNQVVRRLESGVNVGIVSSAAITAGMVELGLRERPDRVTSMPELQMLASIGNRPLLNAWHDALPGKHIGGLLLTGNELSTHHVNRMARKEREQAMMTTRALFRYGHIPVINENDAVTHEEIAFGDNDGLAGLFAAQVSESKLFGRRPEGGCLVRLVILSDVDGVYANPHDSSTLIPRIDDIEAYRHLAGGNGSVNSTGGMVTKFDAAEIATTHQVQTWITNGRTQDTIERAIAGEIGTYFPARPQAA